MGCKSSKESSYVVEEQVKEEKEKEKPNENINGQYVVKESLNKCTDEISSPKNPITNLTSVMDKKTRTNESIKIEVYPRQDVRKTNIRRLSHFANIQEEDEEKICEKSAEIEKLISKAIQASSVLSEFGENQRQALVSKMYFKMYEEGDIILKENDIFMGFVVIESGQVEIKTGNENKEISRGDSYVYLLNPKPSKITVTAKSDVRLWTITGKDFQLENIKNESDEVDHYMTLLRVVPLLSNLTTDQLYSMISMIETNEFNDGQYIIHKGERGTQFYIIKSGTAICYNTDADAKTGQGSISSAVQTDPTPPPGLTEIRRLHENDYFGEIALLHDIPRTIDVVSYGKTECWVLKRDAFDSILGSLETILNKNMKRRFIDSSPVLSPLKPEERDQILESVEIETFEDGSYIVKQGDHGDKFYIIQEGKVVCTKEDNGETKELRHMSVNDHFGERALIKDDVRSANIIAQGKVTVLSISRDAFIKHLGPWEELLERKRMEDFINSLNFFGQIKLSPINQELLIEHSKVVDYKPNDIILNTGSSPDHFYIIETGSVSCYEKEKIVSTLEKGGYFGEEAILSGELQRKKYIAKTSVRILLLDSGNFANIIQPLLYKLEDLQTTGILGLGGFAVVKKVHPVNKTTQFALKMVSKTKLLTPSSQQNIIQERNLMSQMNHPFLVKMITTFQDDKSIYILQEFVEGGDLRTLMLYRQNGRLVEKEARFFSAVVLLGLEHLHSKHIVYRDLKPENVLLCASGYVKITDFGNAKQIQERTYSLCGTPDYMSPEVWLNKGHGLPCDIWAYGVLVYELLNGQTPFELTEEGGQSEQISRILKGQVTYPSHFSPEVTDYIRAILKVKPRQRLGCMKEGISEMKLHKWFSGINFNELVSHTVKPPYIPSPAYLEKCCEAFNSLSEQEIEAATVDGQLKDKIWIEGF